MFKSELQARPDDMPTLEWIGKKAVLNHHREVPYHLLREAPELSAGDPDAGNLLVQGDNLLALKALLPYYAGKVKCVYIDPPYNTGNEGWTYNDNVNSPEMREWLGKVVGREAEDLTRHDKWLCMMYPRLQLLSKFLREDGAIFVSIDDNELQSLRFLMDEVFSSRNFVATIIWQKRYSASNDSKGIPSMHDYIVVYQKTEFLAINLLPRTGKQDKAYKNPDNDARGPWKAADYTCNKTRSERPNLYYPLTHPVTGLEIWPKESRMWAFERQMYDKHVNENRLWWGKNGKNNTPAIKKFLSEVQDGIVPVSWWPHEDVNHTDAAKKQVLHILGSLPGYMTPKPIELIQRIIQIASSQSDLIMDSFAGSGTTGHAVLDLNKQDGGNRRFILVEMDENICLNVTSRRLERVVNGYTREKKDGKEEVHGLGSGFRYVRLGLPLFDEHGHVSAEVKFTDLAAHIFFTETGQPIAKQNNTGASPFLGAHNGVGVYLLFNGILGDKRVNGGNVLTGPLLAALPPYDGPRVIYGEGCRIGEARLKRDGIVFKQIPYAIKVN